MKNNVFKSGFISILFVIILIIFLIMGKIEFALITIVLLIICLLIFFMSVRTINKPNGYFYDYIHNILEQNENILVEIDKFPSFTNKKIYRTTTIEDLFNLEKTVKKPIYYTYNNDSYDFILIDNKKIYVNTIKKDEKIISCLDLYLKELNDKKNAYNLIEDLDKTTIIKVDKDKEFIVYPLNK
ncbi:MAG: hypothetical protein IKF36_01920 [Bacilli bacterium]|nr:hypothetical protein [Bacilli bacterium]